MFMMSIDFYLLKCLCCLCQVVLWKHQVQCFQLGCCFEFSLDCKSTTGRSVTLSVLPPECVLTNTRCPSTVGARFSMTALVLVSKAVISPPIWHLWRDYRSIFKMLTRNRFTAPSDQPPM